MSRFIFSIASLTAQRQRAQASAALANAVFDLLMPSRLILWQVAEEKGAACLCPLVSLPADPGAEAIMTAGPLPIEQNPTRLHCVTAKRRAVGASAEAGRQAIYCLPILSGHQVVLMLELAFPQSLSPYQDRVLDGLVQIYANFAALIDETEFDPLTGLLNRRSFAKTANLPSSEGNLPRFGLGRPQARPAGQTAETRGMGWLGVIDIDHFKRVNDGFGHFIGDEVLVLFAQLIQSSFNLADRAYRFGGEEFVVTIPAATPEEAHDVFETFRARVEAFRFPQVGAVTTSIGYSAMKPGEDAAFAFGRADKALYFAKGNGRNQVHCYETLLEHGHLEEKVEDRGELQLF